MHVLWHSFHPTFPRYFLGQREAHGLCCFLGAAITRDECGNRSEIGFCYACTVGSLLQTQVMDYHCTNCSTVHFLL